MKLLKYILIAIFFLAAEEMFAQAQVVSGKITEVVNGKAVPIVGVNVNITNAQNRSLGGAVSDRDGNYKLQIPDNEKNITLVFSFIGMSSKTIPFTTQKIINVQLESAAETVGTVTVSSKRITRNDMGVSQKEAVSATQKVNMEELISISPVTSLEETLQGQLAGVDIIAAGDPGARSTIRIRGTSSLNASSEPLIVIDGVPYPTDISSDFDFATANEEDLGALINISPTDIESVEVLKDATATAIWGVKGANGVLLITTKKGKRGKTNFSFSSKFTTKFEPKSIPMLNGKEYTGLMQEAIWNSANYIGMNSTTNKYLTLLYATPEIGDSPQWKYYDEYNQDTDWLKEVRQNALTLDNSLAMSGGGEKATYRTSLNYVRDDGTTIGTGLKRFTTSTRVDYNFSNKLKFSADFGYSQIDKNANWGDGESNVRGEAFRKMPNKSPYYIDNNGNRTSEYFSYQTPFEGSFSVKSDDTEGKHYNPVAMARESLKNSSQKESKITFGAEYMFTPGLTYKGWASLNMRTTKTRTFLPQTAIGTSQTDSYANRSSDAASNLMTLQTENKLMYIKNWNRKHGIIANVIIRTEQKEKSDYKSVTSGNPSSDLSDPIVGGTVSGIGSGDSEERRIETIGSLNYTLFDRYVFQTNMNVAGNSSMGKSNRTGYFPSAAFAWNVQNEPFLKGTENWLDETKLRVGVGQSGNAPEGTAIYLGAFNSLGSYMDMSAIAPVRMQLDNLKWETSTTYNLGADLSFFQSKFKFAFDYYEKYTKDLLQKDVTVPATTGYAKIKYLNSGEMTNKGVEFSADVVLFHNKDWHVSTYFNLARNINSVTKLPQNMAQEIYSFDNKKYAMRVEEGLPLGSFFGYRYKGVYQHVNDTYARDKEGNIMNDVQGKPIVMKNGSAKVFPGDASYEDINHDGVINEYDIVYLGNCLPIVTGGMGFTIKWKQLFLKASFNARFGQKIINLARMDNESMYNSNNQSTATLRRWRNPGDNTDIPRALYNEGYNFLGSDRFVEDASFIRLQMLSLNYTFSKKFCTKLGVNSMSLFVTGQDLITWTNYTGQDPEVGIPSKANKLAQDNANTPCAIRLSTGINLNF